MGGVQEADVVVVGLGVGGEEVAGRLAQAGLTVVGIEHTLVGGECPYWGCIPTTMMARAGNALAEARRIPGLAGTSTVQPDWAPVARRIREEATDDWNDKARDAGVDCTSATSSLHHVAGVHPRAPATRGSSRSSPTVDMACWSVPPRPARPAAR
jgi:pyruvate/2-oxoglutarate dehydrogenase complex dihydrolipoamide dehydrogenase (E3) component